MDDHVAKGSVPYTAAGGAFPSGHTNTVLAGMYARAVHRFDRPRRWIRSWPIVIDVHYTLDVIAGRMIVEQNVAHFLNDPAYKKLWMRHGSSLVLP